MTFHKEVLNEAQLAVLPFLGTLASARGFYLGGGTAVALHLGHRRSVDFDFFTGDPLREPMLLAQHLRETGIEIGQIDVAPGTLHTTAGGVRASFIEYQYPLVNEMASCPDCSLALASLDDLACMKLAAIAQRGSRKDFVDVYAIALEHKPIDAMIQLYKRKYSTDDVAHVAVGLAYFDDADDEPSPAMLWQITWDEIKRQFGEWARALAG